MSGQLYAATALFQGGGGEELPVPIVWALIRLDYLVKEVMYRVIKKFLCTWRLQYKKTDDLNMVITEYIRNVDRAIRNTVFENTVRRVNKCLETGGGHFENYVYL